MLYSGTPAPNFQTELIACPKRDSTRSVFRCTSFCVLFSGSKIDQLIKQTASRTVGCVQGLGNIATKKWPCRSEPDRRYIERGGTRSRIRFEPVGWCERREGALSSPGRPCPGREGSLSLTSSSASRYLLDFVVFGAVSRAALPSVCCC